MLCELMSVSLKVMMMMMRRMMIVMMMRIRVDP